MAKLLPPENCSAVLGNPPFIGSKYQSDEQREQTRLLARLGGSGGTLDYVAAWFIKAGEYIAANPLCRLGYVATNSITQGQQVAQLWPILFDRFGLELDFGHRTFVWDSDARGKANVHVVILGLSHKTNERPDKRLFTYPDIQEDPVESKHKALTAYLFGADDLGNRHLVVEERSNPLCDVPVSRIGSKPIDGGYYIFNSTERDKFLEQEPSAEAYIHPYIGSDEFVNGEVRYILALQDAPPSALRGMPKVIECIENVAKFRRGDIPSKKDVANGKTELKKRGPGTVRMAEAPTTYHVTVIPDRPFLALPEAGSERREYLPIGWLEPPTIPSNLMKVILSDDRWHFGVLVSKMHFSWLNHIGGKLKSDPRYSSGIVYNTFPWPEASEVQKNSIRQLSDEVLAARSVHANATLADLYDPNTMPVNLRKAHQALDLAVDRLYRRASFSDDRARVEHLFGLYELQILGS